MCIQRHSQRDRGKIGLSLLVFIAIGFQDTGVKIRLVICDYKLEDPFMASLHATRMERASVLATSRVHPSVAQFRTKCSLEDLEQQDHKRSISTFWDKVRLLCSLGHCVIFLSRVRSSIAPDWWKRIPIVRASKQHATPLWSQRMRTESRSGEIM